MKRFAGALFVVVAFVVSVNHDIDAQMLSYLNGQNISPAFEGWEKNEDGSFDMLFGYMNRNWEEELDVPVGSANGFSPGDPDRGQPTHFLPRRNRFVFKVRVPADWGDKELVWTLTTAGKTERAFASLRPDYFVDGLVKASEQGALGAGVSTPEMRQNVAPTLKVDGSQTRTVAVDEPVRLTAWAFDDGQPPPRFGPGSKNEKYFHRTVDGTHPSQRPPRALTVGSQTGLRVSWYLYRGPANVVFDPEQTKVWEDTRAGANSPWAPRWVAPPIPEDGLIETTITFTKPGTYVIRCLASDGAVGADHDITFTVK